MSEKETTERTSPMPFDELNGLVEEYEAIARPGHEAAFLRSAWEGGKDISKFGDPASPEEIAAMKYDDAHALLALSERLGLSLESTRDLTAVIGDARTGREQYAWTREQFPDKPDRWLEEYQIWAWKPEKRQSLANGVTTLARLTGESYLLASQSVRFKVTPETTADEVMGWYSIPTPEQSLEAEGYVDPRHFHHHYRGFRQAERSLTGEQYSLDHRISQLTKAFRDFGNIEWYNHDLLEHCRVAVGEGGASIAPFYESERDNWRARWAVTIGLPMEPVTIFQDVETGRLGVDGRRQGEPFHEIPEDQEAVVTALESYLTIILAPGAQVRGTPIDADQIYTVLRSPQQ